MTPAGTVGQIKYIAEIDTSKLKSSAKDADGIAKDFGDTLEKNGSKSFKNFASNASDSFGRVASGIAGLAKVAAAAFIGGAFGISKFINEASELQSVRASFESMTGSAEEASKVLKGLNEFSFKTAFSSQDINSAAKLLLGAGANVDDLSKRMQQIGDIAGATGADLGRLTLPLSQAMARGKLQTQDFYQILDSGAGALGQALKKKLADRGMGDFTKAMEQGLVTSDLLFETMQEVSSEGGFAFQGAAKQADTFAGRVSNLKEQVSNTVLELLGVNKATGQVDPNGTFAKLSDAVKDATVWLTENKETIKSVGTFIKDNFLPIIGAIAVAFTVAKVAAILFWLAAASGPTLVAAGIVALVAGLTYLYFRFEWFRNAVNGIFNFIKENWQIMLVVMTGGLGLFVVGIINHWDKVKTIVGAAIDFIKNNWELMIFVLTGGLGWLAMKIVQNFDTIKGVATGVASAIVNAFKWAWDSVTRLWGGITGFFSRVGDGISNAISGAMEGLKNAVKAAINWVIDKANFAIRGVNKASPPGVPEIGEIPKLAKGGVIPATPGGRIVQVAEAGQAEAIIPLDRLEKMISGNGSSGGSTYNLSINLEGVLADSEASKRSLGKQIATALNAELKAQGVPKPQLIGGGRL